MLYMLKLNLVAMIVTAAILRSSAKTGLIFRDSFFDPLAS